MEPVSVRRPALAIRQGQVSEQVEEVVTEYPLTIYLNGDEFSTMVCTPEYLEDLVVGFLASEGIVREAGDLIDVSLDESKGLAHVEVKSLQKINHQLYSKRYITSCCGKSRQSFYFYNDARTAKKVETRNVRLHADDCFRLMEELKAQAELFHRTGGVHNAALAVREGLVCARMDIGRHNALDKIYGWCLREKVAVDDKIAVFSGRLSSEVLLKVAKIGCEVVLTKAAPTELALEMAEELGITAVCFIRQGSLNVYTHADRMLL